MVISNFRSFAKESILKSILSRITNNHIYDMSDMSSNSHISLSTQAKSELEGLDQTEFVVKATVAKKFTDIMESSRSVKNKLDGIEKVRVNNSTERAQKEVFRFMYVFLTDKFKQITYSFLHFICTEA